LGVRPPGPKFRNLRPDALVLYFGPLFPLRSMPPRGYYLGDKGHRVRGPNLGVRPPGPKFRNFRRDASFVYFGPLFFLHSVSAGDGSQGAKWRKVLSPYNPPKMGLENFGGVALF